MKRHAASLAVLCAVAAGCSAADGVERTGEAALAAESLSTPSRPNAIRFLEQATFGPTTATVNGVVSRGITGTINDQMALPVTYYDTAATSPDLGAQFFLHAVNGADQLRQRTAFALSQIVVVSQNQFNGLTDKGRLAMGTYLNTLADDAFGNYRDLMYDITVSPAMGRWLDQVNNFAYAANGTAIDPNENYARELLQLFTLGLYQLNDNGTLKLDANGAPLPTYTQDQVIALAHTLTGWTYGGAACPTTRARGNPANYGVPMIPCDLNHDSSSQTLLRNFKTTAGLGAAAHIDQALDNIFAHPNLPPFVSKQLIQHLVTSNPSPAYVGRVVAFFKDDGSTAHRRGNLKRVLRAILEDDEARGPVPPFAAQASFGKLRAPALFVTGVVRRIGATVTDGAGLDTWSAAIGQDVPRPPSVFSYYPPDAPLPESDDLLGPEFALANSATTYARANFLNKILFSSTPLAGTTVDLSALPAEPGALVQWLDDNMLHDTGSSGTKAIVLDAITKPNVPAASVKPLAVYLVAMSPEYQVER